MDTQEKFTRTGHRGTQTNKPRHNSFGPFGHTTFGSGGEGADLRCTLSPAIHTHRRQHEKRMRAFAHLVVMLLPATMIIAWVAKMSELPSLRRAAIADLHKPTDEAAAAATPMVNHYFMTGASSAPICSNDERAWLLRVGIKLGGSEWLLKSGWGAAADCCDWAGVSCGPRGGVGSLNLAKQGLAGTLPSQLGHLGSLTSLDLNENGALAGTIPSELFTGPRRLTHFYAFGAAVSGTLPAAALGQARALQEFECSACRLSGTLPSALPTTLRYVFLESNRLSGSIPSHLASLGRLRELELS